MCIFYFGKNACSFSHTCAKSVGNCVAAIGAVHFSVRGSATHFFILGEGHMKKHLVFLFSLLTLAFVLLLASCQTQGGGNPGGNNTGGGDNNPAPAECTHAWGEWATVTEPTCITAGKKQRTCSLCGGTEDKTNSATGNHNFANKVCTVCGEKMPTEGLSYTLINNDTEYAVTGLGTATDTDIVIPSHYNGKPVTVIWESAFENENLTSITIPATITGIYNFAFNNCTTLNAVYITDIATGYNISFEDVSSNPLRYAHNLYVNNVLVKELKIPSNVTKIGQYAFYKCTGLTNITIPASVTSIGPWAFYGCTGIIQEENGVSYIDKWVIDCDVSATEVILRTNTKGIADFAFQYCEKLSNIIVPEGVTSIGNNAFSGCTELQSIDIPSSVSSIGRAAFYNCTGLTSITIPTNITSIEYSTFKNCSKLTTITIPASVTGIKDDAFYECAGLQSVIFEENSRLTSICQYAFYRCTELTNITIPVSVTSIGSYAFSGCTGIIQEENSVFYIDKWVIDCDVNVTEVILRTNTKGIADSAFKDCTELQSIDIPSSVSSIGRAAFYNCTGLTSIIIPAGVTSIGDYAFQNCTGLISISIPDSVTSIEDSTFKNCSKLTTITIPNSVTSIGAYAFYECTGLQSVIFEENSQLTNIGNRVFYDCRNLTNITIPASVTSIGNSAFYGCTGLTSISIPSSVTRIGEYAFYICSGLNAVYITDIAAWCNISFGDYYANPLAYAHNLYLNNALTTELEIPNSVTIIKDYVFFDCDNLTSITIPDSVTSIGESAFENCTGPTSISIPASVTSIGECAFFNCTSLNAVYITDIAAWCKISFADGFSNPLCCANNLYLNGILVTDLVIPAGVTTIGEYAFFHCFWLNSVTIPAGVTSIGALAFYDCPSLGSVNFAKDSQLTNIGNRVFYDCRNLTNITIPASVTNIGEYAFFRCTMLTSFTIPASVTSIGNWAFSNCTGLTSITIPDSVTSIGADAFHGCTGLTSVTFENPVGWWRASSNTATSGTGISSTDLKNATTAAKYLTDTYDYYYWKRS